MLVDWRLFGHDGSLIFCFSFFLSEPVELVCMHTCDYCKKLFSYEVSCLLSVYYIGQGSLGIQIWIAQGQRSGISAVCQTLHVHYRN